MHYHLPFPIEKASKPKVTKVNRIEVGFRTSQSQFSQNQQTRQVPEEALMLTGDENIVDLNFTIFWIINDAKDFLFNVRNPEITIKSIGESVMREKIGQTPIDPILSEGKSIVEEDVKNRTQSVLDYYKSGILITQVQLQKADPPELVIESYRDVQRAKTDEQRLRNEAEAYRNDIIPKARGEAERKIQEAEAYKQEVVAKAQGEAQRFISVYDSYKESKDVTSQRIYLETLEKTLGKIDKIIVDKNAGSGIVPYLPLPELQKKNQNKHTKLVIQMSKSSFLIAFIVVIGFTGINAMFTMNERATRTCFQFGEPKRVIQILAYILKFLLFKTQLSMIKEFSSMISQ